MTHRLIYCLPIAAIAFLCVAYVSANIEFRRQVAACHRQTGEWIGRACVLPGRTT